nr:hypothetical protein [Tanacetum cinerariifolium]
MICVSAHINHLARSLPIQGLPNDIYSLIDSNKTAKDLWDALARHMLGYEYSEQDRKAAVLYEYETFKATKEELLLDTYIRYLQVINDLKKCGYSKDNCDVNDAMGSKKKTVVVTSDPLALITEKTKVSKSKEKVFFSDSKGSEADDFSELKKITALVKCYNCKKEGHFAKDCKKVKVKDYEYNKTKMLLEKKDKDEQVLLAEDQAWMKSSSDSDQEINANMVFMDQIEKVLSDSEASSSSVDEKISEEKYAKLKAERYEYMIRYPAYFDNDKQHRKQIADQQVLYDKMSVQLVELDKHIDSSFQQTSLLKPYVPNMILEKIIIDLEDEVVSLLEKEKANLKTIESLKSKGFESSENVSSESKNQTENDCLVVEKEYDKEGMFKLNVSQCVSPISMSKSSCDSNNVGIKLKRKRRKRKSSKQNVKQVDND